MSALAAAPGLEEEWRLDLHAEGVRRDEAVAHLHGLLPRAALPQLSAVELDELAQEAAGDAAVSVLRRLDDFRGESSFRTWAYKFALLEAAVKVPPPRLAGPRGDARAGALVEPRPLGAGPGRRRRERRTTRSPSGSTRTATRSTSCSTTPGGACAPTSPKRDTRR